jgi:hypothetical protein
MTNQHPLHPFQWHVIRNPNTADTIYPYTCFSRVRGFDKALYPNLEYAAQMADKHNRQEKWNEHYPPSEVERCLEKYKGDIFSESFLDNLLNAVAEFQNNDA